MENTTMNDIAIPKELGSKLVVIESSIHQTMYNFRELISDIEQMHMQAESVKKQIVLQQEKCERKSCPGSEELKKVINSKENIIELVASALKKLSETKNFSVLKEAYRVLFGEAISLDNNIVKNKEEVNSNDINIDAMSLISPKKEPPESVSSEEHDDSVSEIEGTPTGRQSPIFQSKKKSTPHNTTLRDKKKCPRGWPTPEQKNIKLTQTHNTPNRRIGNGRLKQQRISFIREKPSAVVDLTTLQQFSEGRKSQVEECLKNIKQEPIENDDTIMPSPTSGPLLPAVYKSISKESPQKFKKPLSLTRHKSESISAKHCKENKPADVTNVPELEDSVNLLKEYPNVFASSNFNKAQDKSPIEADNSMSLLQPQVDINRKSADKQLNSPVKRPLAENVNVVNVPCVNETSLSILNREVELRMQPSNSFKRARSPVLEPLYKEPTVRKLAEKRALPGWSCDQCKNFYDELYKDNPEMLAKKMDECSKHRGRNNPARPATPPGFWSVRWNVPEDTEEFNRRNNVV